MKLLFAASEAAPFIKTGGLGDVAYALPNELANREDVEICVFLPYYRKIKYNSNFDIEYVTDFGVPLAWRVEYCGLFRAKSQKENLTYYFIDNEYYFNRENAYGDYDDGEKFAYYSKAVLESLLHLDYSPDVVHCHDWQTALIPLFLKANYCHMEKFQRIKTLFTIHNIEYQGKVPNEFFTDVLGIDEYWRSIATYGPCLNFMKSAIVLSDKVSTVSKTYSYEIRHAYFAHGLENVLQQYAYKVEGIVNGIDTELFNAQKDKTIHKNFEPGDLISKTENKMYLQTKLHLPVSPTIPMIGMISRLVSHKGLDLIEFVAKELMELPIQLVVIGTGDERFQNLFYRMAWEHPDKCSANIIFDPILANQLYAGADLFLMPSQSEPCGLSQLISMRYGTIPVVRETGGLYDTVPALNTDTLEGRGFTFKLFNAHDMLGAIKKGIEFYQDKNKLKQVVTNLMTYDCSWREPANLYMNMYKSL